MNVLFLTLDRFSDIDGRGIYKDLMREFVRLGHSVYIARPAERQFKQNTHIIEGENYAILAIKTLNIQKTNLIEKGLGTLSLEWLFKRAINKYWGDIKFDLVLYSTPPITFNNVIQSVKKRCNARTYLLLKDIFPQNAVDLQMFSKDSSIYKFFRKKEEQLYEISDKIGCMSPANIQYVLDNNPSVNPAKVELCPNSIELVDQEPLSDELKVKLKQKLGIPIDKTLFIYGGNLGKPQGIDFLIKVIAENEHNEDAFIMIVGSGTEFGKIQSWFNENHPRNAKLMSALPKAEYDNLIKTADVGLIFLDPRFKIPNYPSRLLSYLENKMPILMATDINTDIGSIAEANGYGLWCESGNTATFMQHMKKLTSDLELRQSMGEAGYNYLCNNYLIEHTINKIMKA
jgi:glycosyltransferase involved in cell wall biosynthesis